MRKLPVLALLLAVSLPLLAEGEAIQRFALVVGSNVGGKTTATLRYAVNDAKRFRDVLVRLGGTREENVLLLVNPEGENLQNGLSYIGSRIKKATAPGLQTQVVFYYSGHSDERGLLLSGEYFGYPALHAALDALGADVRVVVLDSCSSGAFTRDKGGTFAAPFLMDASTSVEGHAYITSSSAEEASQESDKIESSFFTFYFLSGLRGAADSNSDGKVTLNEAYDFAYDRTLSDTEKTRSGAQHPAFDIKLNGMGNLVLTDLRAGEAAILLPKELIGRVTLRDVTNKLVLEVRKDEPKELRISVEQGYYRILLEEGRSLLESTLIIDESRDYLLGREAFHGVAASAHATRGPGGEMLASNQPLTFFPLGLSLESEEGGTIVQASLLGRSGRAPFHGLMTGLFATRSAGPSSGVQLSLIVNFGEGEFTGWQNSLGANAVSGDLFGVQTSGMYNEVGGNLKGVQLGGMNLVKGDAKFGQFGAWNTTLGGGDYFQAGLLNNSRKAITGVQAGALNIAKKMEGVQFGLVNFSEDHRGLQIGLVNVSKRLDGLPIGLIDIQYNGENHIDIVAASPILDFQGLQTLPFGSIYLRFGSRYFYKYFNLGMRNPGLGAEAQDPVYSVGGGLGLRVPLFFEGFAFHLDGGAAYHSALPGLELTADPDFLAKVVPQFRTFASWRLAAHLGLVCGLEHWVYTRHFQSFAPASPDFSVRSDFGVFEVDSRLFLGLQL